jgi:hypothetical protein
LKKHTTQAKLQEKQERNNKKKRETGIVSCRSSTCSVKGRKETKEKKRVRKITPFEPAALPQHSLLLLRKKKKKKQEPPPSAMPVWISQQQNYKEHRLANARARFKVPYPPSPVASV